jgi:hypothetical protein
VFVGGLVLPDDGLAAPAAAARARREFAADVGLGIGGIGTSADGRQVLMLALDTPAGTTEVEHVLGGGPTLALTRAAKAGLDLVRHHAAAREPAEALR